MSDVPEPIKQLAAAYNHLAFDLLRELLNGQTKDNVVISPLSIAIAPSILYEAAQGQTRQEIGTLLNLNDDMAANLKELAAEKIASIKDQPVGRYSKYNIQAPIVEFAASLWGNSDTSFSSVFEAICTEQFGASIHREDFAAPDILSTVNNWISEATHGKITDVVDNIQPDAILILIAVIYLKAKWSLYYQFDIKATEEGAFHLPDGRQRSHPIMRSFKAYPYREDEQFQVIRLDFEGDRLGMVVCLPAQDLPLETLYESLTFDRWQLWMSEMTHLDGTLGLPRFKASQTISLPEVLSRMGMGRAFDPEQAQFEDITSPIGSTFLQDIVHSAIIEVNEAGVEAAGVTVVRFVGGIPKKSFEMIVNRPFFWAIEDQVTGAILFAGVTVDPEVIPATHVEYDEDEEARKRFKDMN